VKNQKTVVLEGYQKRNRRYYLVCGIMGLIVSGLIVFEMLYGNTIYPVGTVIGALMGENIKGASYTVVSLRLPRMLGGLLCGFAFGMAGNIFQKLLGNPLASPDIIGVSSGSSVAAVYCILVLRLSGNIVSVLAMVSGLLVAGLIYLVAGSGPYGFSNSRLILTGIGAQAFLNAMISWMLLKAAQYDVPNALRWLSGSLNNVELEAIPRLMLTVIAGSLFLGIFRRHLEVIELGNSHAVTLGLNTKRVRILLMLGALILIAYATSVSGPIASVAFLAGPIANKLAGEGKSNMLSSGLTGAILVMASDMVAQYAFSVKYPVGVLTGILGAPYLIYLLIVYNRKGI
jgi:iron complex transport system permease protein